jgi:hypothetical protein
MTPLTTSAERMPAFGSVPREVDLILWHRTLKTPPRNL